MVQDGRLEATVALSELPRVAEQQDGSDCGGVTVAVAVTVSDFTLGDGRVVRRLTGDAAFTWQTVCQRSLDRIEVAVTAPIDVVLAADADDTGETWDAWPHDAELTFGTVIEEYLLLALPLAPTRDEDCRADKRGENDSEAEPMRQPFAGLKDLMQGSAAREASALPHDEPDIDN